MKSWLLLMMGTSLLLAVTVVAKKRLEHEVNGFAAKGAKELRVELEFGAGELTISPEDMPEVAIMEVEYDPRRLEYETDYEVDGEVGYLYIETVSRKRHKGFSSDDNKLDLTLSTRYPLSLKMDVGASDAEIELGGLPLQELDLDVGAASGEINFSEPNPHRLGEITVDAGASSLDIRSIGNANFDRFTFSGGAGSFDLDFRGAYKGESVIEVEVGVSSVDITLPEGVPARVETSGSNWLSSVELHHSPLDKIDDDVYESEDFEDAETRIILKVEVGLGSVDIDWQR